MRRFGLFVSFVASVGLSACSSSSGGGTGGSGGGAAAGTGGTAQGGAGGKGGGSAGTTGSGGSAGTSGNAGTSGGGGAGAACGDATGTGSGETCNAYTPAGNCVTETFSTATPPNPAGGTFFAGTYNLTSLTAYVAADAAVGSNGQIGRQTFVVSNVTSTSLTLDQAESSGALLDRSHGSVAIVGMDATFTPTCPVTDGGDQGGTDQFTASSSGFTLFEKRANGDTVVSVFAKAP